MHPLAILMSIYIGIKVYSRGGFLLGPISAFLIWQLMKAKESSGSQDDAEEDGEGDASSAEKKKARL